MQSLTKRAGDFPRSSGDSKRSLSCHISIQVRMTRSALPLVFGVAFFLFCKTFHAPGRSAERGIAVVANKEIPSSASFRNLMDRRTGDVIFPGQQSNAYVFCVMPPINLLSLLGGSFVRLWMFISGSSFPGVSLPYPHPACKQPWISLQNML